MNDKFPGTPEEPEEIEPDTDSPLPKSFSELLDGIGVQVFAIPIDSAEEAAQVFGDLLGFPEGSYGERIAMMARDLYYHTALETKDMYHNLHMLADMSAHIQEKHHDDASFDDFRQVFPDPHAFLELKLKVLELNAAFLSACRDLNPEGDLQRQENLNHGLQMIAELRQELKRAKCLHLMVQHSVMTGSIPFGTVGLCRNCATRVQYKPDDRGLGAWSPVATPKEI